MLNVQVEGFRSNRLTSGLQYEHETKTLGCVILRVSLMGLQKSGANPLIEFTKFDDEKQCLFILNDVEPQSSEWFRGYLLFTGLSEPLVLKKIKWV